MKLIRLFMVFCLTFSLVSFAVPTFASNTTGAGRPVSKPVPISEFAVDQILVKFKDSVEDDVAQQIHKKHGCRCVGKINKLNIHVVSVNPGQAKQKLKAYQEEYAVEYAEPDYVVKAIETPNDPYFDVQWGMLNIRAPEAWDVTNGAAATTVAILDTGIDQDHEDLAKVISNANFTSSGTVDDNYGHGTHVGGIAAAATNNGKGVAGVGYACSLMNVKVLGDNGSGYDSWVANGIVWAADNGADVINMSLGGSYPSSTLEAAVNYAWGKGVVVVAAAGNDGDTNPEYPAAYQNCIAVVATDQNDSKAGFSNYGDWVDIAAPGVNTFSTLPNHRHRLQGFAGRDYGYLSGTSMASPHAAGAAALVVAAGITDSNGNGRVNDEVRQVLEGTAKDLGDPGKDQVYGYGLVDAAAAVTAVAPPGPSVNVNLSSDKTSYVSGTDTNAVLTAMVKDETGSTISGLNSTAFVTSLNGSPIAVTFSETSIPGVYTANLDISGLADGSYTVEVTVTDSRGVSGTGSTAFSIGSAPSEPTTASVDSILYTTEGGRFGTQHLLITATIVDDFGNPIAGASVSIGLYRDGSLVKSFTGTTGTNGTVTFKLTNASPGTYTSIVTGVTAEGLTWDGATPSNEFIKT